MAFDVSAIAVTTIRLGETGDVRLDTKNARITGADIVLEDNILTAYLQFSGMPMQFGGYALEYHQGGRLIGTSAIGLFVRRTLLTVGCTHWSALHGQPVRIKHSWSKILALGHYSDERWFEPEADVEFAAAVGSVR